MKRRARGASDAVTQWSLVASLASAVVEHETAERGRGPVFVEHVSSQGCDYSVGVTDANKCRPLLDVVEDLPAHGWTDIGMGESATWVRYRPAKWKDEQSHAVVRGTAERQGEPVPRYAMILANRDDLPLAEVVRRHRSKQGPALTGRSENAFEGPLVDMDLHHPPCRDIAESPNRLNGRRRANRDAVARLRPRMDEPDGSRASAGRAPRSGRNAVEDPAWGCRPSTAAMLGGHPVGRAGSATGRGRGLISGLAPQNSGTFPFHAGSTRCTALRQGAGQ